MCRRVFGLCWREVLVLSKFNTRAHEAAIYLVIGTTILVVSLSNLYCSSANRSPVSGVDHLNWLPLIALVIGNELGFLSAGDGTLGVLALLSLAQLTSAQVIGTDMILA